MDEDTEEAEHIKIIDFGLSSYLYDIKENKNENYSIVFTI